MAKSNTLWIEKFRPDSLDGYIGNDALKTQINQFLIRQDIPHLLFIGKPGTGKTTAAKILLNGIQCDKLVLNASDDNNIETVRTKIRSFAVIQGFEPLKIILLDEFDGFTRQGQEALRNLMEQFSNSTRFILTANYVERVIDPIISRSQEHIIVPPSKKDVKIHLAKILTKEGITFKASDITLLVDAYFPDIRKVIGEAQSRSYTGALVVDEEQLVANDVKLKIVTILKTTEPFRKKFDQIRQLVADSQVRDFTEMYRMLFDHVTEFAPKNIPECILTLAEGQYKDSLVVDKEINMMATFINLLNILK
jgi:DNA polymerase III delta prime subunit